MRELPTLDEFIGVATRQYCRLKYPRGTLWSPKGREKGACLSKDGTNVFVVLPDIGPDEKLSKNQLERFVRILKIAGYESILETDNPDDLP